MSRSRKEKVICPQCGKQTDITIWETINAEMNPVENRQLLDRTLFRFTCECGYTAEIDANMLYHNMTHHAMVYYINEESIEQTENMFADLRQHSEFEMTNYIYRIVTSQNALREKAIILENGLDDRVIELVKLFFYAQIQEQLSGEINEVLFFAEDGEWFLQFFGSSSTTVVLPIIFYKKIRDQYATQLEKVGNKDLHIDVQWAVKFLGYDKD